MKNIISILVIIVSICGCKKDTPEIKGVVVNLISNDDPIIFKKSVILFDNSNYLIKTPLDTFIMGYPFNMDGYTDLKNKAINDGALKDILTVSDYLKSKSDSINTLAYYLETGKCYLFDKQTKKSINTIQVEAYKEDQLIQTTSGRRFYIRNKLFLETVDMISIF
jgi:hypothetical protein